MSRRIRISAAADGDIIKISQWIARDSLHASLQWIENLDEQLRRIGRSPGIGTDRSELRPNLRSTPLGQYVIFFQSVRDSVTVVRIIHGAKRLSPAFQAMMNPSTLALARRNTGKMPCHVGTCPQFVVGSIRSVDAPRTGRSWICNGCGSRASAAPCPA